MNIAGLKDKLQDNLILHFLLSFYVVFLVEVKQSFFLRVPEVDVSTVASRSVQRRSGNVNQM